MPPAMKGLRSKEHIFCIKDIFITAINPASVEKSIAINIKRIMRNQNKGRYITFESYYNGGFLQIRLCRLRIGNFNIVL